MPRLKGWVSPQKYHITKCLGSGTSRFKSLGLGSILKDSRLEKIKNKRLKPKLEGDIEYVTRKDRTRRL